MAWLRKIKTWWKRKTVWDGYKQFHCIHNIDDIYKDVGEDIETRCDTSNNNLGRPLSKGKY